MCQRYAIFVDVDKSLHIFCVNIGIHDHKNCLKICRPKMGIEAALLLHIFSVIKFKRVYVCGGKRERERERMSEKRVAMCAASSKN